LPALHSLFASLWRYWSVVSHNANLTTNWLDLFIVWLQKQKIQQRFGIKTLCGWAY